MRRYLTNLLIKPVPVGITGPRHAGDVKHIQTIFAAYNMHKKVFGNPLYSENIKYQINTDRKRIIPILTKRRDLE